MALDLPGSEGGAITPRSAKVPALQPTNYSPIAQWALHLLPGVTPVVSGPASGMTLARLAEQRAIGMGL